eukprot:g9976.t1
MDDDNYEEEPRPKRSKRERLLPADDDEDIFGEEPPNRNGTSGSLSKRPGTVAVRSAAAAPAPNIIPNATPAGINARGGPTPISSSLLLQRDPDSFLTPAEVEARNQKLFASGEFEFDYHYSDIENDTLNILPPHGVEFLSIENFKSYGEKVTVGPFQRFTCIIGPNGSGKSNVMDALSFVLGVDTKVLRSDNLKELIHRKPTEFYEKSANALRTASVAMVFKKSNSLRLVYTRTIAKTGVSSFYIDEDNVSKEEYLKSLERIHILSKARNFLVFQGDIDGLTRKQGALLTQYFEQISGSEYYKKECERLALELSNAEQGARLKFAEKREALENQKVVGNNAKRAEEYLQIKRRRDEVQRESSLFQLSVFYNGRVPLVERVDTLEAAFEGLKEKYKLEFQEAKAKHDELRAKRMQQGQTQIEFDNASKELKSIEKKLDLAGNRRTAAGVELKDRRDRLAKAEGEVEQTIELKQNQEKMRKEHLARAAELKQEVAKIDADMYVECEPLLGTDGEGKAEARRIVHEAEETAKLNNTKLQADIRKTELKSEEADKKRSNDNARLMEAKRDAKRIEENSAKRKKDLSGYRQDESKAEAKIGALQQQLDDLDQMLESLKAELVGKKQELTRYEDQVQLSKDEKYRTDRERLQLDTLKSLVKLFPGRVYGRLSDLCKPSAKTYQTGILAAIGIQNCQHVLVQDQETCRECVQYLKTTDQLPMTFVPVADNRFDPSRYTKPEKLKKLKNATPVLDCLVISNKDDVDFTPIFQKYVHNCVIVDDLNIARDVAYNQSKKVGVQPKVCCLSGQAFDPAVTKAKIDFGQLEVDAARTKQRDLNAAVQQWEKSIFEKEQEKMKIQPQLREQAAFLQNKRTQAETAEKDVHVYEKQLDPMLLQIQTREQALQGQNDLCAKLLEEFQALKEKQETQNKGMWEKVGTKLGLGDVLKYRHERDERKRQKLHEVKTLEQEADDCDKEIKAAAERLLGKNEEKLLQDVKAAEQDEEKLKQAHRDLEQKTVEQKEKVLEEQRKKLDKESEVEVLSAEYNELQKRNEEATKEKEKLQRESQGAFKELKDWESKLSALIKQALGWDETARNFSGRHTNIPLKKPSEEHPPVDLDALFVPPDKQQNAKSSGEEAEKEDGQNIKEINDGAGGRGGAGASAASKKGTNKNKAAAAKAPAKNAMKKMGKGKKLQLDDDIEMGDAEGAEQGDDKDAEGDGKDGEDAAPEIKNEEDGEQQKSSPEPSEDEDADPEEKANTMEAIWAAFVEKQAEHDKPLQHDFALFDKLFRFDFDKLPEDRRNVTLNDPENPAAQLHGQYTTELHNLNHELTAFQDVKGLLKAQQKKDAALEDAQKAAKESAEAQKKNTGFELKYNEVRELRRKKFMECFNVVKDKLDVIYKELTSTDELEGGAAFLDIECPDAPFDGGIKYTTMPPAKRFRDMHLLSGGEKTLAALALCFAVHHYQKPPFIILDEVDAPLDSYNVKSVRRYLSRAKFQSIVISLKDELFCQSDALFGVFKDQRMDQSGTLSTRDFRMPLGHFDDDDDTEEGGGAGVGAGGVGDFGAGGRGGDEQIDSESKGGRNSSDAVGRSEGSAAAVEEGPGAPAPGKVSKSKTGSSKVFDSEDDDEQEDGLHDRGAAAGAGGLDLDLDADGEHMAADET